MNVESSGIQVGEQDGMILIRVEGKGTYLNSHLLKQYFLQCLEEDRHFFKIDLSQCNYMDSTFLGMLAGIGSKVKEHFPSPIKLANATERIRGMLENLGIEHLFEMSRENRFSESLSRLSEHKISSEAKTREMLEAHEKLAEISPANEAEFRDVITLLRKKIGKTTSS